MKLTSISHTVRVKLEGELEDMGRADSVGRFRPTWACAYWHYQAEREQWDMQGVEVGGFKLKRDGSLGQTPARRLVEVEDLPTGFLKFLLANRPNR